MRHNKIQNVINAKAFLNVMQKGLSGKNTVKGKLLHLPPSVSSGAHSVSPSPGSSASSSFPPDPDPFSPAAF